LPFRSYWVKTFHMALPHLLTLLRVVLSPLFMLLYVRYESMGVSFQVLPYLLILLLVICEMTDALDGFFARKLGAVSDLGKLIDPMADSIYRISVFLTFTRPPVSLPLVIVFLFLYRDSFISTLRQICALKGFALAARPSGKLKAVLQAISAFVVLILFAFYSQGKLSEETLSFYSALSVGLVALYALGSGIEYIWANRSFIKRVL
jgi:CDP-diacylglycerol---glycerol-3-phosphate 3-phosphatidyltransferase